MIQLPPVRPFGSVRVIVSPYLEPNFMRMADGKLYIGTNVDMNQVIEKLNELSAKKVTCVNTRQ